MNETYVRLSGYSREELLTLRIQDMEAIEKDIDTRQHIQKIISEGGDQFESRHRRKDGSVWDVEVSAVYSNVHGGQFFAFIRDISERKRAEEENALLQDQFLQAQKMESVGRLAGGVAHDFNNMLGVILGHAELALKRVDPGSRALNDLEQIITAANRSADLTRQLLIFARKQTVVPRVLNLSESITSILKMLERMIGENIRIRWEPSDDLWSIKIDPSQLNQILINLCVNARDAIQDVGTIKIGSSNISIDGAFCAAHVDAEPGQYVHISVSDDGCGISADVLENIFEPFFTTKEFDKGTGLGLATVYGTVRQNGGFITVDSILDKGTTFNIYLPRHTGRIDEEINCESGETAERGDETILLVEDEPNLLMLTAVGLESNGYTVLSANGPEEAIRLAENQEGRIDLLLTDVIMPVMNGHMLASRLVETWPHIRCLFTSGYMDDIISSQGVLDKDMNFIAKPFTIENLLQKVREVLNRPPTPENMGRNT